MALSYLILIALSVAGSCVGTRDEANAYMDSIVGDYLRTPVASMNLDPVHLPWYKFDLERASYFEKYVSVLMDHGSLHGLSGVLQRQGDCQLRHPMRQNVTVTCNATLDGLRANFRVFVQQDTFPASILGPAQSLVGLSNNERLEMDFVVKDSRAVFQITAGVEQRCSLKTFHVTAMDMNVKMDKELKLGNKTKTNIENAVKSRVRDIIREVVEVHFKDALDEASRRAVMSSD